MDLSMNLNELYDYKNKLVCGLCSDDEIVKLVTNNDKATVPNQKLPYTQVFPFQFVPETTDNATTFICLDVDIPEVLNKTFLNPVIYIWIFTHKSLLRLPEGGVRTDRLSTEVNRLLNGSRIFGLGELNLQSVGRFVPISDYQGRVLTYSAKDFNRSRPSKTPPSNRRG